MAKHIVGTVDEIPPGGRKLTEVAGRAIGIFNVGGQFFALRNRCPHQGGPLCEGRLAGVLQPGLPGEYHYERPGELLRCPWHGWEFDVRTGQSWFDPARTRVRAYEVQVASGAELSTAAVTTTEAPAAGLQPGPYVAETYPVTVEQQYLVIEL
jgi:3-phenylpropionate/trans-cinnamate dioxygenase ferredoxin subunit